MYRTWRGSEPWWSERYGRENKGLDLLTNTSAHELKDNLHGEAQLVSHMTQLIPGFSLQQGHQWLGDRRQIPVELVIVEPQA